MIGVVNGLMTALLIILFIGIWLWAWSKSNKPKFEKMAKLPLESDDNLLEVDHDDK